MDNVQGRQIKKGDVSVKESIKDFMQLDEEYKVTVDPMNFRLEKLEDIQDRKTGEMKQEYKTYGYFGRFEHLLKTYANEKIRQQGSTSIDELVDLIGNLHRTIEKVVKKENIKLNVQ